jgi:preprotein translocase subunit SecD
MNRYPVWKYIVIAITVLLGALYTAPNYFGESPALQVTSGKSTVKVTSDLTAKVEQVLKQENLKTDGISLDGTGSHVSVRARFLDTDTQFKAKLALERALNPDANDPAFIVTNNLTANTPVWMQKIRALPMYLGLDLRGGVHFLMQVDVQAALEKRVSGIQTSVRAALRDKNIRHAGIERKGNTVEVKFRDEETRKKARAVIAEQQELNVADGADGADLKLVLSLKPAALKEAMDNGVKQNIATLSKRVNELGVAEPIIQQQGADRSVVQLPGVQDVARAKALIGRTATLEVRMVDETIVPGTELQSAIPFTSELFTVGKGVPVVLYKDIVLSGDYISRATASFDSNQQPAVSIDLNGDGGRKMREATRDRVGKKMAIVLYEQKGKPEVLSVATIQSELGSTFQITGMGNAENSAELALLLRSGALYAPMTVIEERTVGPALGAENIQKGKMSMIYGFSAIAIFMIAYYMLFGFFSVLALGVNLLLLMALLSRMQATLTLPGIAAIALALGMAIDANVLINERIREELRKGNSPQAAIADGFKHAWDTIIDSNVTTLIVGIALYVFGSGPVRGFAVVHCLGILTSMFSAVFVSRGVVNLWYGRKKKLQSVSIGTVWVPGQSK